MVYMMTDILQYLPYALIVGAVFLMIMIGLLYTISHFRKANGNPAKR